MGDRVGVRGPSLYKHVRDRAALIRPVADDVADDLASAIAPAVSTDDPRGDLPRPPTPTASSSMRTRMATRCSSPSSARSSSRTRRRLADVARPLIAAMTRLVGEERALSAARTIVAWAHGFVTMELAGAFRLGGDLDEAFAAGLDSILGTT